MCKDIANLYENFSYSFFGPMEMFFSDELNIHDEPYELKLSISVVLVVIMLASVVGNLCTCAVVARKRSMRTPTNFYLLSLAVSDLLIALFIPIEIYMMWVPDFYPFGESGCLLHFFLFNGLSNSSVLIISAFTVERYLVVSKPFLYKKLSSPNRVFKIAIIIWIISWSISLPEAISSNVLVVKHYVLCYGIISNSIRILIGVQIFFFFLIPMATISVLYVLIAGQLKSREKRISNSPVYAKQSREKIVRMLGKREAFFILKISI
ncbi:Pyrokinin-1 receptor [Eumeta japonica]|uniref:Pyrokinin-1 receptor n=1 Tax=Eumeta variegata TaxID=151549 RepID=A0A4C1UA23_EUMVA|nr:Pyrokinin-1 receptor [Eumeta japonica]